MEPEEPPAGTTRPEPASGGGPSDTRAALARVATIGTDFAVTVGAAGFLGWLVDYFAGTDPWGLLSGLIVGLVVGFARFVREALATTRSGTGRR